MAPCKICGKHFTASLSFCGNYLIRSDFPIKHYHPSLSLSLSLFCHPSAIPFPILQRFLVSSTSWHGCPHGSAVRTHPLMHSSSLSLSLSAASCHLHPSLRLTVPRPILATTIFLQSPFSLSAREQEFSVFSSVQNFFFMVETTFSTLVLLVAALSSNYIALF